MMKKTICFLCGLIAFAFARSQDIYTPVLQKVEQGSVALQVLKGQMHARQAANHTGLTPADPEVEFGYLWSHPASGGNRKDVSFTQQFDFPTAYAERARLAGENDRVAELDYRQQRQQILLQAKQLCVEMVYQNALHEIYLRQADWAKQTAQACKQMLDQGESGLIEYNKAVLNQMEMENQLKQTEVTRRQLQASLSALAGGQDIVLDATDYADLSALPQDFDTWFSQAESVSPALQYLGAQVEVSRRQVKVTRAQSLPKLSVGYIGELVPSQKYNGVTVGMSIPLWENKGRMRQARAEVSTAQMAAQDARVQYYTQLRSLYEQAVQLQKSIGDMEVSLNRNADASLLQRAYEEGEITLLIFLMENSYYLSARTRLLETRRDLELILCSLLAWQL